MVTGDIYLGMANNSHWSQVKRKLDTAVPNATFNRDASMQIESTTVQGAFITFTAMGSDAYFLDPRATGFVINIHDIHTVHTLYYLLISAQKLAYGHTASTRRM